MHELWNQWPASIGCAAPGDKSTRIVCCCLERGGIVNADDMAAAEEDMMDATDDLEEGHKEAPGADMRKGAEKRGAEATLDKGEDHDDAYIKEDENPVDALVAEITSKVISRLNK